MAAGVLTPELLEIIKTQWLPDDAADNGWDDAKITSMWTGGIPTLVYRYWYDRVQQTAGYLDVPDPGGTLPITQIHRQAMEMLQYWGTWLKLYGNNTEPIQATRFGKIRKRYDKGNPFPIPYGPLSNGPYNIA